jgi:acyl transferase domain-containing protein
MNPSLLSRQRFDSRAFGISLVEASTTGSQQRLLVELGYMALHASSQRRFTLIGSDSGVFVVGTGRSDWALAQPPPQSCHQSHQSRHAPITSPSITFTNHFHQSLSPITPQSRHQMA